MATNPSGGSDSAADPGRRAVDEKPGGRDKVEKQPPVGVLKRTWRSVVGSREESFGTFEESSTLGLVLGIIGVVAIVAFSIQFTFETALSVVAVGVVVAGASWLGGAFLGFLFGNPRASDQSPSGTVQTSQGTQFKVNTNLEQISDWLTKIIVGIGLVQIGRAPGALTRLADALAPGFGDTDASPVFALAVVVYFSITGFLTSYLWAQLRYRGQLHRAEKLLSLEYEQLEIERVQPSLIYDASRLISLEYEEVEPGDIEPRLKTEE
jgi:hypothetical protein